MKIVTCVMMICLCNVLADNLKIKAESKIHEFQTATSTPNLRFLIKDVYYYSDNMYLKFLDANFYQTSIDLAKAKWSVANGSQFQKNLIDLEIKAKRAEISILLKSDSDKFFYLAKKKFDLANISQSQFSDSNLKDWAIRILLLEIDSLAENKNKTFEQIVAEDELEYLKLITSELEPNEKLLYDFTILLAEAKLGFAYGMKSYDEVATAELNFKKQELYVKIDNCNLNLEYLKVIESKEDEFPCASEYFKMIRKNKDLLENEIIFEKEKINFFKKKILYLDGIIGLEEFKKEEKIFEYINLICENSKTLMNIKKNILMNTNNVLKINECDGFANATDENTRIMLDKATQMKFKIYPYI